MDAPRVTPDEALPGRRTAAPAPPPAPCLGRVLAEPMAAALEDLADAVDPARDPAESWVRKLRIASRRLRTMLALLIEPGDPRGLAPLRTRLGEIQEGLSESRDREVVLKWVRREEVDWGEVLPEDREALALALGADAEGAEAPAPLREALLELHAEIVERVRDFLPEELHRPVPAGMPGLHPGGERDPGLPPSKALGLSRPPPRCRAPAAAVLAFQAARVEERQLALATPDPAPEALHDLRREARKLRYQLEGLLGSFPELGELRKEVKQFQWLLGQVQDRRVIRACLAEEALPAGPAGACTGRLPGEVEALLSEAREIRLRSLTPAGIEGVLAVLRGG